MKMSTCHPNRKAKVGDLCASCYGKHLKLINPGFKARQEENSKNWKFKNPEKYAIYKQRERERYLKRNQDSTYKLKRREYLLKTKYNLSLLEYDNLLKVQNNSCAICLRPSTPGTNFHVDHCHKTNRIRGLLCHQCNWYLGLVDAEPDILRRLFMYRLIDHPNYLTLQTVDIAKKNWPY